MGPNITPEELRDAEDRAEAARLGISLREYRHGAGLSGAERQKLYREAVREAGGAFKNLAFTAEALVNLKAIHGLYPGRTDAEIVALALQHMNQAPGEKAADSRDRIAAQVMRLHIDGLSQRAIAARLNEQGTPTISGSGSWGKGVVGRLIAEELGRPAYLSGQKEGK